MSERDFYVHPCPKCGHLNRSHYFFNKCGMCARWPWLKQN